METAKIKNEKQRNSSIELLRIISMVMILSCHFATHGGFSFDTSELSVPRLWWDVLEMGGYFGVDVFVLISGYFLVTSKGSIFNFKRILKFWGQVFFYSVAIYFICGLMGISDFGVTSMIKAFFPITFEVWWFASTYFVLYLIHPFLNMLLQKLDQNTYKALITMQLIMWCVIPTFTTSPYQGNILVWFVTLYCVAGYVRLFGLNTRFTVKGYAGFWLLFSGLRYLSCVVLTMISAKVSFVSGFILFFYEPQSILTFLSALSLFMVFEKMDMGHVKGINMVASATFGVYLIHENETIRSLLWFGLFKNAQYQDSVLLIPYSILVTVIVYAACTLIDLLRQRSVEKPFMVLVDRYSEKVLKPFEKILDFIKDRIFGK